VVTCLHVPQTDQPVHPYDNSTVVRSHYEVRPQEGVALGEMRGLATDKLDSDLESWGQPTFYTITFGFEFCEHYRHVHNLSGGSSVNKSLVQRAKNGKAKSRIEEKISS